MMLLNISFHYDFYPLLVVAAIAWTTPILLSVLKLKKIPIVIVEIILGFLAGQFLFGNLSEDSFLILDFFALLGFLFLMFLSGLEIDVDHIIASLPRRRLTWSRFLKNPLLVGITQFILAIFLSYLASLFLAQIIDIPSIWYFSLIMVTTSVSIVLPILKDRGEIGSRFGQMIIIAAAVADILSIILFTFTAFIIKNGFHYKLLYILALFILFFIFYKLINRLKIIPLFKRLGYQLSQAASQIRIRGAILIIMIFVFISQYIGKEVVLLGAFLSGLVLSSMLHRERSLMLVKLDGMGYGYFIPFFFIMVGAGFDPSALTEFDGSLIGFLLLLIVSLFAIKVIPSFLWRYLFGTKKALSGGFLMSSRLSLIIAASAIGLELDVITPGINASIIIMAVITCFISPVIYNWISSADITEGNKTIIIGGSSTAVLLARRLHAHGKKAVILELDKLRFREIKDKGINVIFGNGLDTKTYRQLKLTPDNYIVIETTDDEQNLKISQMLRNEFQHKKIISRINRFSLQQRFKQLGVETIDVTQILASAIENLIIRPTTYHALVESFENFSVEEILITNKKIDGLQIKEIPFHKDAILIMVRRGSNFNIPHGENYLRIGDVLLVFGTQTAFEDTLYKVE
ncbi:MAG: monovalent cation:proton antiporter family protein [candidate division Zixibacteria bacterium]|nr:monovalent cation:proton antiporter family protein [candidate division Zixibacteria bacterium]